MRDFLLDTQTIHYWYDKDCNNHAAVAGNVESLVQQCAASTAKPRLMVSVVSLGEIQFGHNVQVGEHSTKYYHAKLGFLRESQLEALDVTEDAVVAYGEIRARLFGKFAPLDM